MREVSICVRKGMLEVSKRIYSAYSAESMEHFNEICTSSNLCIKRLEKFFQNSNFSSWLEPKLIILLKIMNTSD